MLNSSINVCSMNYYICTFTFHKFSRFAFMSDAFSIDRNLYVNSILSSAFDVIYVKEQIFDMVVSHNTLFCTNTEIELKVAFSF